MNRSRTRTRLPAALAVASLLALATACGSSDTKQDEPDPSAVVADLRDKLPDAVKESNQIKVATSIYPPVDFYEKDGKTLTGFDHDLMEQVAKRLGVTIDWNVIDFAAIIPGIQSKQYDFATDLNDTAEREEMVDFVTQFRDGTSILVEKGNPEGLSDLDSLCGKTVAVTKGSTQVALVKTQNAGCSEPIEMLQLPDDPDAMLAMRNGRADAYLVNTLAGSYAVNTAGQDGFEVLEGVYDEVFAGLAFPKSSTELRDAVQAALQSLIDDGTYAEVMSTYGLDNNMIDKSVVNAVGSQ